MLLSTYDRADSGIRNALSPSMTNLSKSILVLLAVTSVASADGLNDGNYKVRGAWSRTDMSPIASCGAPDAFAKKVMDSKSLFVSGYDLKVSAGPIFASNGKPEEGSRSFETSPGVPNVVYKISLVDGEKGTIVSLTRAQLDDSGALACMDAWGASL